VARSETMARRSASRAAPAAAASAESSWNSSWVAVDELDLELAARQRPTSRVSERNWLEHQPGEGPRTSQASGKARAARVTVWRSAAFSSRRRRVVLRPKGGYAEGRAVQIHGQHHFVGLSHVVNRVRKREMALSRSRSSRLGRSARALPSRGRSCAR